MEHKEGEEIRSYFSRQQVVRSCVQLSNHFKLKFLVLVLPLKVPVVYSKRRYQHYTVKEGTTSLQLRKVPPVYSSGRYQQPTVKEDTLVFN